MKTVYIIPRDGLGGVEQAVRTIVNPLSSDFSICHMVGESCQKRDFHVYPYPSGRFDNWRMYWLSLKYLWEARPGLVICSLWRSTLVGVLYCFFSFFFRFKRIKLIVFVHSSKYSNIFDRIVSALGYCISFEIWCDSDASRKRFSGGFLEKTKVISFFLEKPKVRLGAADKNGFIYWGRISYEKNILGAIDFFMKVKKMVPDAFFYIYGPPNDASLAVEEKILSLGSAANIHLMGVKPPGEYPSEISDCKFYLSASLREGMAISVIEGMLVGLVPIVSPVGEVPAYCISGENAFFLNGDLERVALDVVNVMDNDKKYFEMRRNALSVWADAVCFSDDMKENIDRVAGLKRKVVV